MGLTRRDFLRISAVTAAGGTLAGCGGFSTSRDRNQASPAPAQGSGSSGAVATLRMVTWAGDAELASFKALAEQFRSRTGTSVDIQAVPFSEALTNVDAQLQSANPPDVFRVTYNDLGVYSSRDALLDLAPYLPSGYAGAFNPGIWQAVADGDRVYGVPHHTDTSMLLVNRDVLRKAGVGDIPQRLDEAWTWEQFVEVARKLKRAGGTRFPFAVNWQQAGAYRWLNFLSQAGGRLLGSDLRTPAVPSPESIETLRWTQSFFTEGLVPPTSSTKGQYASELFPAGTVAMAFVGDFLLADMESRIGKKFTYDATFMPRKVKAASDLGGNALVATRGSKNPQQAAEFLKFMVEEESMKRFCIDTTVLPTRTALAGQDLPYKLRPELMRRYVQQATTITPDLVEQTTIPQFNAVNSVLVEQLERAFVGRQDPQRVLSAVADGVARAVR